MMAVYSAARCSAPSVWRSGWNYAITSPLWHPGQHPVLVAGIGAVGGSVMAATMAASTGWALTPPAGRCGTPSREWCPTEHRLSPGVTTARTGQAPSGADAPAGMSGSAVTRLLILAGIWGCSFLFIKVSLDGLSPVQVVLGRITLGAVTLAAIVAIRRGRMPRDWTTWAHLALVSVLSTLLPFYCFAWGEQTVDSSVAGIYNATTPLFTLLVAMAALPEERPTAARLLGIALGFAGVVVVLAPWQDSSASSLSGQLACLAAGVCYGCGIVYTRRFLSGRGHAPLVLATGQLICCSIILLLAVPLWANGMPTTTTPVVLSLLALGILGTGVAYLIFYGLIGEIGATSTSTVTYVIPLVAVALGVVALGEQVGWNDFAGAAVVVAGIAVAEGRVFTRSR